MIEKIFGKFLRKGKTKPFSAWQIELTTRCPLRCKMCIRSESSEWQYQDMPLEDFKKILPYLEDVETVVLEGWGESLLHKDLSECIRLVKKEGSQVGFVTSGMGLTQDRVSELIEAGVDFVGFSISGTTPETHDAIRVNSHLPDLLAAIRLFQEEQKRRGLLRPKMHLIFLMVKDNIHEVPSVPSLAKEAGVEEVVLTNICHTINPWQETQRVFVWEDVKSQYDGSHRAGGSQRAKVEHPAQETEPVRFQCARLCREPAPEPLHIRRRRGLPLRLSLPSSAVAFQTHLLREGIPDRQGQFRKHLQ